MRESCEIGHSFLHLRRREFSSLSQHRQLRFGHGRPSYIKIQENKVWDFVIAGVCCMVEVKGRVTGVVLRLAGSCMRGLKMWENWWKNLDRQPTCASSPPHGRRWNRSRGSRSGPKMCHRKRGGGPTWVFLFAHVIRVNEKKILQKFVKNRNTDCHILE